MTDETKCILGLNPLQMGEFFQTVKDIKENVDKITDSMDRIEAKFESRLKEQDGRIDNLEQWRAYMLGGIAIIAVLLPIITKYVL